MSSKTRKFIGPMSLVAMFAVIGALAAFVVLGLPNVQPAEAQGAAPGVPGNIVVTPGETTLGVSWSPPAYTGAGITGYELQYIASATEPASDATWLNVGSGDTDDDAGAGAQFIEITGLTGTVPFYVRIRANSGTPGDYSGPIGPHSLVPDTVPDTPVVTITVGDLEPQATGPDRADVTISWTVEKDGGDTITGYTVTLDVSPATSVDASDLPDVSSPVTVTTLTIPDVLVGGRVTATVLATNGEGSSPVGRATDAVSEKDILRYGLHWLHRVG